MWTTLLFGIGLVVFVYGENATNSTPTSIPTNLTTPFLSLDADKELKKMETSCLMPQDYEAITGGHVRYLSALFLVDESLKASVKMIGLTELRSAFGFAPLPPWKAYNETKPSDDELAAASTIEDYYNLKEPQEADRSLNSTVLYEKNTIPAIKFLDERLPAIREIFRNAFRTIPGKNLETVNRKIVDILLEEYDRIQLQIYRTIRKILSKDCLEQDEPKTTTTTAVPTTTTTEDPTVFIEEKELEKLEDVCLSEKNYEELTGNIQKYEMLSPHFIHGLFVECTVIIGLTELRSELGFGPMHPWKAWNSTKPSEKEILSASTVEAYYDPKEPKSERRSLNSHMMHEKNTIPAIAFFDKKFPAIRKMFRRRFEVICEKNPGEITREIVDISLEEYEEIYEKVIKSLKNMRCRGTFDE